MIFQRREQLRSFDRKVQDRVDFGGKMDLKETGKKLKPFAPVLSVAVVASCVAGTLSGYQPPVYAAQEQTNSVKEETTKSEEQEQAVKGSFDLTDVFIREPEQVMQERSRLRFKSKTNRSLQSIF